MFSEKPVAEEAVPGRVRVENDSTKDDRTVFVSNLAFTADESSLREFFSDVGDISELRLVKYFKCRSKSYAYVIFQPRVRQHNFVAKFVFLCFRGCQKLNLFNWSRFSFRWLRH